MIHLEYKPCSKCELVKPFSEFNKLTEAPYGLRYQCKQCLIEYRIENKDAIRQRDKAWREKNKHIKSASDADYRAKNSEYLKKSKREYYFKNRDSLLEYKKNWYEENKEKKSEYDKKWRESRKEFHNEQWINKYYTCPLFRLTDTIRSLISQSFRKNGYRKTSKTAQILGCSFEELKEHIENQFLQGMSWENRGEWHIDHIVPVCSAKNEDQLIAINHYTNLRPLWAIDNLSKGGSYCELAAKAFYKKMGVES